MELNLSELGLVYIVCGKTDFRKRIDSLAHLVKLRFDQNLSFFFYGGKSDRFKALYWDGEGFWLLYKEILPK